MKRQRFTEHLCQDCRDGTERPMPDIGPCQCPCDRLHPQIPACTVDVPAVRILQLTFRRRLRRKELRLPVCLPCAEAVARTQGAR